MSENTNQDAPSFEVDELDDQSLEEAAGGTEVNLFCPKNTCNTTSGCGDASTDG